MGLYATKPLLRIETGPKGRVGETAAQLGGLLSLRHGRVRQVGTAQDVVAIYLLSPSSVFYPEIIVAKVGYPTSFSLTWVLHGFSQWTAVVLSV